MCSEVDLQQDLMFRVPQEIVEVRPACAHLQPVDTAIAAIVEQYDVDLLAKHHLCGDLRIQHQVRAVANHDHDLIVGFGHLGTEPARNLITHAGETILAWYEPGAPACQSLCISPGRPPAACSPAASLPMVR